MRQRGGLALSATGMKKVMKERRFLGPLHVTSTKTGEGWDQLREAIKQAILAGINWDEIPCRTMEVLFKRLKDEGRVLMRFNELRETLHLRLSGEFQRLADEELGAVLAFAQLPQPGGRKTIAQRLIAGVRDGEGAESRQGRKGSPACSLISSAPAGLERVGWPLIPAMNRWAMVGRPWRDLEMAGELKFGRRVRLQPGRSNASAQAVIRTLPADEHQHGCPEDNSPAIDRWGSGRRGKRVPSGTKELGRF